MNCPICHLPFVTIHVEDRYCMCDPRASRGAVVAEYERLRHAVIRYFEALQMLEKANQDILSLRRLKEGL